MSTVTFQSWNEKTRFTFHFSKKRKRYFSLSLLKLSKSTLAGQYPHLSHLSLIQRRCSLYLLSALPKLQLLPTSYSCVILTSSSFLLVSTSNTSLLDWLQFWQSLTWYCINIQMQKAWSQLDNCILVLCYMTCGTYKSLRKEKKVIIGTRHLVSQSQKIFFIS